MTTPLGRDFIHCCFSRMEKYPSHALSLATMLFLLTMALDYLTPPELGLAFLYLFPIMIVAWIRDHRIGSVVAILSTIAWLINAFLSETYSHCGYAIANALTRMGIFLVVNYLVAAYRFELETERKLARTDGLTQITNRRYFMELLESEIRRCDRFGHSFAVIYLDIDHFKRLNDTLGHAAGDQALRTVAAALCDSTRQTDIPTRLGGDEFAVLLPESDVDAANKTAGRIFTRTRQAIEEYNWPISISIGTVAFLGGGHSASTVLGITDRVLYAAKAAGKNQIHCAVYDGSLLSSSVVPVILDSTD